MSNPKRTSSHKDDKTKGYWLYGNHAVRAALANPERNIRRVIATQAASDKIMADCRKRGLHPEILVAADMGEFLPADAVHQGVGVQVLPLQQPELEEYLLVAKEAKPLIILDQVTDPHNVGAILRSAAAFNAGAVIITRDNASHETATLAKASSGAIEIVPMIAVTNLVQCMETLKKQGFWCIGLDGEATSTIESAKLSKKTALVLGAEGRGLRRLTAERCDLLVKLPISPLMESLNVSNAAAVALYIVANPR